MLAYLNGAIYDAAVAAWDSKYAHNRPRPSEVDPTLTTAVIPPASPCFPSEHAVAAMSRVIAGVLYPSDTAAGLGLGRAVRALAVERIKNDNFGAKWEGVIPNEPGKWAGPSVACAGGGTGKHPVPPPAAGLGLAGALPEPVAQRLDQPVRGLWLRL